MTPPRLELTIDELVVRGLSPEDARAAATALEARLVVLAGAHGGAITPRSESFRRLQDVQAPSGSPAAIGDAVAGAVWGGLVGGGAR